tara:strand:+ start:278 stop:640 length:363 start_codon:yes stop_codon:yes gene_type:complete
MKTSLKKCLSIQAGLIALSESKMLDLKNSFAVAKNIRALEPVIESFNEVKSDFESKIKDMADDEGNVAVAEVEEINKALEEVLDELHVVDLAKLDMSKMDKIDVPARVIAQVLDIAEYNG